MKETRIMAGSSPSERTVIDTDDDEINLMEFVRALWRGRWTVILVVVIATLCAGYYVTRVATPQYQSTVDLTINVRHNQIADMQSVLSGVSTDQTALNTELEIIRSRNILGQVVDRLDLTADPEFNPDLRTQSVFDQKVENLKAHLSKIFSSASKQAPSNTTPADPAASSPSRERAIGTLRRMLTASIKQSTYVFTINVTTGSPELSEKIANTLADIYIQDQIKVKFEATEQAVTWLSDRVTTLEAELKKKQDTLKNAVSNAEMVTPDALANMNTQAKELRDRLKETQNQITQTENRVTHLTKLRAAGNFAEIVKITEDNTLNRLLPSVRNKDSDAISRFDQDLQTILDRAKSDITRQRRQADALEKSLKQLEDRIQRQSADLVRIQQMQREVEATKALYETFLTRLKETSVQRGLQQADSRVLSHATPGGKVAPKTSQVLALSVILGAMLGGAMVLIRNFVNNAFRTSEELEAASGIMVMGQIPRMPLKARRNLITYLSDKPTSASTEAIRNLRTSVLLSNIDAPPQVIMTTSAVPGEGKTTIAISLAHNFAGLGKQVLLIEGDIRRRRFREYFDVEDDEGLIAALSESKPLEEIIKHDTRLGADILLAERSRVNPADLFSSDRFGNFITQMREAYDIIIIDTPPVLVVPDARVIGQYVDSTLFAVAWDRTHRGQVTAALRDLASVNLNVAGLVLSQIDPKGMRRYGYGGKYGAYSSYGKSYYEAE